MMLPVMTTFDSWAASLVIDFPTSNIPLYTKGTDWKTWGNLLSEENIFSQNGVPRTNGYSDPMEWAKAVFKQMSNIA